MYDSNYVTLWKRQNYRNSNKRLEVSGGWEQWAMNGYSTEYLGRQWKKPVWYCNDGYCNDACMLSRFSHVWLCDPMDQPARLLWPWDVPGKNTGVGYRAHLQGIFLTKGSKPSLLHYRQFFTAETLGNPNDGYMSL